MANFKKKLIIIILIIVGIVAFFLFQKISPSKQAGKYKIEDATINLKSNNGYNIKVRLIGPKFSLYPDKKFPAVLRIGGGWGTSSFLLNNKLVNKAASNGFIIVGFETEPKKEKWDAELRDFNGFKDQDDVATVLKSIMENSNIDVNNIGVWSHSNGITLASGVLGRKKYSEISKNVKFLLDDEGPHCPKDLINNPDIKFHTKGIREMWEDVLSAKIGDGKEYSNEDNFWSERCAVNLIPGYKGIYQRVQAIDDHEPSTYHGHAVAMVNAATNGNAKWTRLNNQPKNQIYSYNSIPSKGINIENVLKIKKFSSANDKRIWNVLFNLFEETKK